jgi:hypothetical protein
MVLKIICTGGSLLLAIGGFLGASPSPAGPLNLFGIVFLSLSGVVWLGWEMIGDAYAYREEVCPNQGHVFLQTERLGPALVDRLIRK